MNENLKATTLDEIMQYVGHAIDDVAEEPKRAEKAKEVVREQIQRMMDEGLSSKGSSQG